jgi:hypothetical protein
VGRINNKYRIPKNSLPSYPIIMMISEKMIIVVEGMRAINANKRVRSLCQMDIARIPKGRPTNIAKVASFTHTEKDINASVEKITKTAETLLLTNEAFSFRSGDGSVALT